MVLLTITPSIAEGLKLRAEATDDAPNAELPDGDPSLENPAVGDPISHGQIIHLWKSLRCHGHREYRLESLLRGAKFYVPPPPPKPEPSNEYKALMARLRRDEELRVYERMVNPPPPGETFSRRSPNAAMAREFAEVNRPSHAADTGDDDDVTYNDVHRQVMLIINFLASMLGVAAALWVLARWWSTPARLFLAMGGSIAVGIAEVALYSGYLWHLGEAKKNEAKVRERKEVMQSWVVGGDDDKGGNGNEEVISDRKDSPEESSLRRRKQKEPG